LQRAVFLGRPANRKKNKPAWWKSFAFFFHLAAQLKDDDVFKRVVQLTRKSDMPTGKRALMDWLRVYWFPGCFWGFTNNGISALIVARLEDTGKVSYNEGSIKNIVSTLNLWRPVKPLYWGLDKNNKPVPLR
jgi:hypothetical protein